MFYNSWHAECKCPDKNDLMKKKISSWLYLEKMQRKCSVNINRPKTVKKAWNDYKFGNSHWIYSLSSVQRLKIFKDLSLFFLLYLSERLKWGIVVRNIKGWISFKRMKWEVKWGGRHYFVRGFDSTESSQDQMSYIDDVYLFIGKAREKHYMYFATY